MAKITPIERLQAEIDKILDEYGDNVRDNLDDITKAVGKKGVQALKSNARSSFNGTNYAGGWKSKAETGRLSTTVTIYNAKLPGLPHLLEHGHAKRGGGRVEGRAHIAPVEREIIDTFEKEIEWKL